MRLPKRCAEDVVGTGKINLHRWAAKHEYEEVKEGIWLEPALALLRKKTKEKWTEKVRNVARKLFLGGGWV